MSTKKISRRDFLKVAGISAAAIGLTACGGSSSTAASTTGSAGSAAASAESATFSVTADVTGDRAPYVERFAELISDKTGGRYQANVIAAGSLGNGSDMAQMLQMGTLDVLMSDDMTIDGVLDGALGFAWLPGLVADYDEADKYYLKGWIADEVAKIMEQNSLIRISSYCNGFRQVGNIVRPVTEMSDLAGLKIRTPSVASVVSFYEKCGALPVMIAGSEVLNALQTGTVDGLDNAVFNYTNQGICSLMLQLSILNVDLHAHHGTAHGFAQAVQTQAHGGTAAQSVLHNKVEAVQAGHVVAGDLALDHVAKVGFEFFGGHLALNDLIVFRFACIHTDIAGIALVAGAAVSNIVQIDLCHLTSPPECDFRPVRHREVRWWATAPSLPAHGHGRRRRKHPEGRSAAWG